MSAGMINILVGCILVAIGLISLTVYAIKGYRAGILPTIWKKVVSGYLLLLANFPLAFVFIMVSGAIAGRSTIAIHNQSSSPIKVVLHGPLHEPNQDFVIGVVPPKTEKSKTVRIPGEGAVTYSIATATKTETGIVFGYITSGISQSAKISVDEKLNVSVDEKIN